jgi:hypothetical protein
MIMAGLIPLSLYACSEPLSGDVASSYISEDEARQILLEKFTQKGLNITEDFQFSLDSVTFNADGFDAQKKVGYEYLYNNDYQYENENGTNADEALSEEELSLLENWNMNQGPYFLTLKAGYYIFYEDREKEEQLRHLESDIDEYLAYLINQGII